MQFFFRSFVEGIPKPTRGAPNTGFGWKKRLVKMSVWTTWIWVVTILSLPSIFFTCAQSIPAQNAWDLADDTLMFFHGTAPLQAVIIDMLLAVPISNRFSRLSGIQADKLLMTFRMFSAWLLALVTTTALDESCFGGWKLAWKVCQQGSEEYKKFNWKIYDEEILNTGRDICTFTNTWMFDGRCTRAIVGGLTPFLLKKLLVRSTVQPLLFWALWHFSRLEPEPHDAQEGRHRKLFGVWPKTTKSLMPLQQMALLTTHTAACLNLQLYKYIQDCASGFQHKNMGCTTSVGI